ncbi:MAG: hypothetical protein JXB39_15340 [Deltaproteobacteria bacterium]|nr:hypothetical protein [Deltaproteobacteria bacterium]
MLGRVAVLSFLLAIGCTPKGSFQGKLVHAITGQPVAGKVLALKSDPPAPDLTCQNFNTRTDASGLFTVDALCGDATYKIEATDKEILLDGPEKVQGSEVVGAPVEIKVWPAPPTGVYILSAEGGLTKQAASWKVEGKNILNSEEKAFFPTELPSQAIRVGPDQYLVLAGDRTIESLHIQPLIDSGPRTFGTSQERDKDEAWSYIGVKFSSDTEFERVEVTPRADRVLEIKKNGTQLRYIEGTALPAGKYTIMPKGGKRAYILEFIGG